MKKLLIAVAVLCVFLIPSFALAANNNLELTTYDVNIVVNEDSTYDITENITANFFEQMHGLKRDIPIQYSATRQVNGEMLEKQYRVIISNVEASTDFSTETADNYFTIKCGDADVYVSGPQKYTLWYKYDPGDDGYDTFDDFYFDIIGAEWGVPISNVTFTITMPKEFDATKIGFNLGTAGTSGYENIDYSVNGNIIKGKVTRTMQPYEALTTRIELPQGYFVNMRQPGSGSIPLTVACLVLLVFGIIAAFTTLRRRKPVQTVEFYPPEGMTSADVGYVIDGLVENKDVISLIIYWADKGYLEIHQQEGSKNITFVKKADLPQTANKYEKTMFDNMFAGTNTTSTEQMKYKFYTTIEATNRLIASKFKQPENLVFTKSSLAMQTLMSFLAALPLALLTFFGVYQSTYEVLTTVIFGVMVLIFGWLFVAMFVTCIETWRSEKRSTKVKSLIIWAIVTIIMDGILTLFFFDVFGLFTFIPIGVSLVLTFIAPNFRNWTEQGAAWAGRIMGLKNFIQTVELDKLKMMVNENPQYFYNILPFAYVLGVTDKWSKQFETIAIEPPRWYYGYGYNTFSTIYFTSMMMHSLNYAQASMASRPQSSGGGSGFSGGGFSGGGGGGGGGGGW